MRFIVSSGGREAIGIPSAVVAVSGQDEAGHGERRGRGRNGRRARVPAARDVPARAG
ncbi:hypothetical protein SNE510_29250 [Streptomyces sp. NE5-10]|nr:hypothetical protein SNE510_29250 [Streptomyces sp. NE5-10]